MGLSFFGMRDDPVVVVHDFDVGRAFLRPDKADADRLIIRQELSCWTTNAARTMRAQA